MERTQMRNGVSKSSILFGTREFVGVSRGLAEFRAGRPLLIRDDGETVLALPVEGLDAARLDAFAAQCAPKTPRLIITARRASSLGLHGGTPMALQLEPGAEAARVLALVGAAKANHAVGGEPAGSAATAAIDLVKLAQLLPAVLVANLSAAQASACDLPIVTVEAEAVARFRIEARQSLTVAGEASVPLSAGIGTRFVAFRDAFGDSPVAVVVGNPDPAKPVPVRLHSACLTGDVFGSRRCDCGDQLKLALARLHEAGGGVILYLAQEGRGVGLANKMRTYQLQDTGLDTVDANTTLGFDDDERDYGVAVRMLQTLGYTRIVLLTNNPAKLDSLAKGGIEIAGRMALEAPINADNRRYLTAKATRNGHHLADLLASIAETSAAAEGRAPELAP
jgi:GTP cyclohydrolase II